MLNHIKMSKEEAAKNESPYIYYDLKYMGDIEDFKKLLKKKMSFDYKDMGNNTIYLKIKRPEKEIFVLFMQTSTGTTTKKLVEIPEEVYKGALLSLDSVLHSK